MNRFDGLEIDQTLEDALSNLNDVGFKKATAKAKLDHLNEQKKVVKASLMNQAELNGVNTISAQEKHALDNDVYREHLVLTHEAQKKYLDLEHSYTMLELRIGVWRTIQASIRQGI